MKFLLRFPQQTLELFISDDKFKDQQWNRYLHYMLKQESGKVLTKRARFSPLRKEIQLNLAPTDPLLTEFRLSLMKFVVP